MRDISAEWQDVFVGAEAYAYIAVRERNKAIDVAFERILKDRLTWWLYWFLMFFQTPGVWHWVGLRMEIREETMERGHYQFFLKDELLADTFIENKIKIIP